MKQVTIYADGACRGNPGPGGYGTILVCNNHSRELSAGYARTTNNRMELHAVIAGLEALKEPCNVRVVTDSQYVAHAMTKGWAAQWRARGWRRATGEKALNSDLWKRLLDLCDKHKVVFEWIRGHAGHPMNERCDELAVAASSSGTLLDDR